MAKFPFVCLFTFQFVWIYEPRAMKSHSRVGHRYRSISYSCIECIRRLRMMPLQAKQYLLLIIRLVSLAHTAYRMHPAPISIEFPFLFNAVYWCGGVATSSTNLIFHLSERVRAFARASWILPILTDLTLYELFGFINYLLVSNGT